MLRYIKFENDDSMQLPLCRAKAKGDLCSGSTQGECPGAGVREGTAQGLKNAIDLHGGWQPCSFSPFARLGLTLHVTSEE